MIRRRKDDLSPTTVEAAEDYRTNSRRRFTTYRYRRFMELSKSHIHIVRRLIIVFITIDVLLFLTRRTYFFTGRQNHLSLLQKILYAPGQDGTYAQNYQDTWIIRLAVINKWLPSSVLDGTNLGFETGGRDIQEPEFIGKETEMFFLDVGAYNGNWCSNSRLLEMDDRGRWEGICVEPFPVDFVDRKCQLFVNAMASTAGLEVNFDGKDQERRISTGSRIGNRKEDDGNTTGITMLKKGATVISTINFPQLLHRSKAPAFIHFISLDVEGQEYDSLRVFPFDSYTVGAWIVENGRGGVAQLLESHGYIRRPVKNRGVDEYFVKDEFWSDALIEKEWRKHPIASWGC